MRKTSIWISVVSATCILAASIIYITMSNNTAVARDGDAVIDNSYHDDSSNIDTAGSSATSTGCGTQKFEEVIVGTEKTKFVKTIGGTASLNCCRADHVNCIRWICGSGADFAAAYKNGHHGTGFQDDSSGTVCWSGRIRTDGKIDVYNDQNITGKNNLANTYTIGQGMIGMSDALQASMNAAANDVGSTTKRLAYWCDDMVPDDPPEPEKDNGDCNSWNVGGYGMTDVLAAVKNESTGDGWIKQKSQMSIGELNYESDSSSVWAKPGDTIHFRDCYYSGLQDYYNKEVTRGSSIPSGYGSYLLEGRTSDWENYSSEKDSQIKANPLVRIQDDTDWSTNGYNISGIVSGGGDMGKSTPARMYQEDKYHTVDPVADLGYDSDGDLSDRAQ